VAQRKKRNSDHALMIALACGATVEAAARQLGISERAAYRRMEKPDFKRELNQLRSEVVQRAAAMLTAAMMESVKTLLELQKPNVAPSTRLGAARSIIELGMKLCEFTDLGQRLLALEQQMQQANQRT
jgi:hypothetical protein